jgi:hypothetical protein
MSQNTELKPHTQVSRLASAAAVEALSIKQAAGIKPLTTKYPKQTGYRTQVPKASLSPGQFPPIPAGNLTPVPPLGPAGGIGRPSSHLATLRSNLPEGYATQAVRAANEYRNKNPSIPFTQNIDDQTLDAPIPVQYRKPTAAESASASDITPVIEPQQGGKDTLRHEQLPITATSPGAQQGQLQKGLTKHTQRQPYSPIAKARVPAVGNNAWDDPSAEAFSRESDRLQDTGNPLIPLSRQPGFDAQSTEFEPVNVSRPEMEASLAPLKRRYYQDTGKLVSKPEQFDDVMRWLRNKQAPDLDQDNDITSRLRQLAKPSKGSSLRVNEHTTPTDVKNHISVPESVKPVLQRARELMPGVVQTSPSTATAKMAAALNFQRQGRVMSQNTELKPHTRQREARIKMAQALLDMNALRNEMESYSLPALQKAAAAGRSQDLRVKYAALATQYAIEKQAFLSALLRAGAKYGGKALSGVARQGKKALGLGAGVGAASGLKGHSAAPATPPLGARNSHTNAPPVAKPPAAPTRPAPSMSAAPPAPGMSARSGIPTQTRKALATTTKSAANLGALAARY